MAGTVAGVTILTRNLDPTTYGHLALVLTAATLVNQVIMGGIGNGLSRFYSVAAERNDTEGFLAAAYRILAGATAVTAAVALGTAFGARQLGYSGLDLDILSAFLFALVLGYSGCFSGILNAARKRQAVALHVGTDAWLRNAFALGAIVLRGPVTWVVIIAHAASVAIIAASQHRLVRKLVPKTARAPSPNSWTEEIWKFSWPFSVWGIFTWAQLVSDRWALAAYSTPSDVGQYVVAFQLGFTPLMILTGLAVSLLAPILYERAGDGTDIDRKINARRITIALATYSGALTALTTLIALLFHRSIYSIIVSEPYWDTSHLLPSAVLAGGLFATGQILSLQMMSNLQPGELLAPKIGIAILSVALNIVGAKYFGAPGVLAGLVLGSAAYVAWIYLLCERLAARTAA
jgi:O-antigen/teichoic acid export membrane protein